MTAVNIEEKIAQLLGELFEGEAFSDCFLLEAKLNANQKVEVFLDSDTGITFDKCQRISRYLEQHIDENNWLGEKYTLEVSSPGVSRPLVLLRQYPKHLGRKLELTLTDKSSKTGKLLQVLSEAIVLEEEVKTKEGKKNKRELVASTIAFNDITKAIVKVSF